MPPLLFVIVCRFGLLGGLPSNYYGPRPSGREATQIEKEEPQPQVVLALGFLIMNCAPIRPSS